MAELGLSGAVRGKARRTTIADPCAARPADLVPGLVFEQALLGSLVRSPLGVPAWAAH
jgi:hypothetical protein